MIDPKVVEALVVARSRAERSPLNELTARELEVLAEIAQGKSNTAIAESLFLTKRAVEKHINAIFWKLGLADAADVSKRVQGGADVPGRGDRRRPSAEPAHVGRVDAPRCGRAGPAAPAGGRRRGSAGSRRTAGSRPAPCPRAARWRRRRRTGSPPFAHTTRTPMTRAPGRLPRRGPEHREVAHEPRRDRPPPPIATATVTTTSGTSKAEMPSPTTIATIGRGEVDERHVDRERDRPRHEPRVVVGPLVHEAPGFGSGPVGGSIRGRRRRSRRVVRSTTASAVRERSRTSPATWSAKPKP